MAATGVLAAGAVLVAARRDPLLSPDSITYLSTAEQMRNGNGMVDFTGEALAHFPPVFPLLLAVGGRSLWWAAIVGALATGVATALFAVLLRRRVRRPVAIGGAIAFALAQAIVHVGSTVWSEMPYLVLALATMAVLARPDVSDRAAAAAGVLAGLAFLTRYAGAGLVVTGLVMVVVASAGQGRPVLARRTVAYGAPVGILGLAWMARNLVASGRPLGPHFEGGAGESLGELARQTGHAVGQLLTEIGSTGVRPVGYVALTVLLVTAAVALVRRPRTRPVLDAGMAAFALTSILVPVLSRAVTGTHIESRIMSPVLVPALYLAAVAVDRLARGRIAAVVAVAVTAGWCWIGAGFALDGPDRLPGSAANRHQFAPALYDAVAALPEDAPVLTNNPQRVWWFTDRVPVRFAFTEPEPGNSHFPLTASETVRSACAGEAFLAWFEELRNAGGRSPAEVRPDIASQVELTALETVPGGTLFRVTVGRGTVCPG